MNMPENDKYILPNIIKITIKFKGNWLKLSNNNEIKVIYDEIKGIKAN